MNKRKLKKWGLWFLILIVVTSVTSIVWVNHQLIAIQGSYTKLVDPTTYVSTEPKVVITNVNILATDCSHFIPNQTILLENGKIIKIGQDSLKINDHTVIDGTGKYLIPGLVDAHVHLKDSKNDLLLYLAKGVTHVREMTGNKTHIQWRNEINKGAIGPKIFVSSEKVNSKSGFSGFFESWTRNRINYASVKGAKKVIKILSEDRYDAVKISSHISQPMFETTLEMAKEYNIPVLGHIPNAVKLEDVYGSGMVEIAHVEEIVKSTMNDFRDSGQTGNDAYLGYLETRCDDIAKQLAKNKIAVVSTIWLMESLPEQKLNLETFIKRIPLNYVNPALIEGTNLSKGWLPGNNSYEVSEEVKADKTENAAEKAFWDTYVAAIHMVTKALCKNNVVLMAGTDANTALTVPGFSLHDELESLNRIGISNGKVLYSVTRAPAEWMNSNSGEIKVGFNSDLILLKGNPLDDITEIRNIEAVFFGKFAIQKDQINTLLNAIKEKNNESRTIDIEPYLN